MNAFPVLGARQTCGHVHVASVVVLTRLSALKYRLRGVPLAALQALAFESLVHVLLLGILRAGQLLVHPDVVAEASTPLRIHQGHGGRALPMLHHGPVCICARGVVALIGLRLPLPGRHLRSLLPECPLDGLRVRASD